MEAFFVMSKNVLVIKLGTAAITGKNGAISTAIVKKLAAEIALLRKQYNIVLVSSGAVGSGKNFIHHYQGTITERKAAAAIGNPILIRLYHKHLHPYGITVAQALCERHHFANRKQFLQLKETFETFWRHDILPVVNENDLVSNLELKFSDNDELATLLAVGFNAATLLLVTTAGGFLNDQKQVIPVVEKIDAGILGYVTTDKSSAGLGGMVSKLASARLAISLGIPVIICGLGGADAIANALKGKNGTQFLARPSNLKARQKWLASGSITPGSVTIDNGAVKALQHKKSLLTVGITQISGKFLKGEAIQIKTTEDEVIGVAKARFSATELQQKTGEKNVIAAHVDDIVLL